MGRNKAAQKQKKAEKAKVKLKGQATKFLPKGRNVTNTSFKVRKIVLHEQLKTPDGTQPLTKRKLNIKEVLSRLQHYSSSQREEGLNGLIELLKFMDKDQRSSHLPSIVDGLAKLALDVEAKIRKLSAHILTSLLTMVGEAQLLPFSAVLSSYLCCAMTHIQLDVQEDSLLLLDALLQSAPSIIAASASQVLPCCLDMISLSRNNLKSSRQLSVNLSSNLTSFTWRARVFARLQALLSVSLTHRQVKGSRDERVLNNAHHLSVLVSMEPDAKTFFPLFNKFYATSLCLSNILHKSCKSSKQLLDDSDQLKKFTESLMLLMFESWMEVNPKSSKEQKKTEENGLQLESALILHSILEIINLLWQHNVVLEKENSSEDLTGWFKSRFVKDMNKYFGDGFPYTARVNQLFQDSKDFESQGHGRRRPKSHDENNSKSTFLQMMSPFFTRDEVEQSRGQALSKCVPQNLMLCHILAITLKSPSAKLKERIFDFLISCLNSWGGSLSPWSDHLMQGLRSVLERSSKWGVDVDPLVSAVVMRYQRSVRKQSTSHKLLANRLSDLLGEMTLHEKFEHLSRCESLSSWISDLPASLTSGTLTVDRLCFLNKLASQKNSAFLEGLQRSCSSLIGAIINHQPTEGENLWELELGLASLFYWIPNWNKELVFSLEETLSNNECPGTLARRIMSILSLR